MILAGTTLAAVQGQTAPTSAPTSAPAATNPYQKFAATAPSVPNERDNQPFTNDTVNNLKPELPTLFIAGDSTAATGNRTTRGWAALLVDYFDTSKVNLSNRAVGGQRFNTYTGTWNQILGAVKPGDFVVIQMGHNSGPLAGIGDETQATAARGGAGRAGAAAPEPIHTHGWYVKQYITDVRAKKATPIVMSLTLRDLWKDGKAERVKKLNNSDAEGMSDWSREAATIEKALFLDHSNIIGDIYDKLGPAKVHPMFGDGYLHTNTAGAIINCEAFIAGLKALPNIPLVDDLNEKGKAIPAYKPASTQP